MKGEIRRVSGPLVVGEELERPKVSEIVRIGEERLFGEVIRLLGDKTAIQVYEPTEGLRPGDRIEQTGELFTAMLGPGMLTHMFDGIQRPMEGESLFLERGMEKKALDMKKEWHFTPREGLAKGSKVSGGEVLGHVQETHPVSHAILVPPLVHGRLQGKLTEGDYTLEESLCSLKTQEGKRELKLYHEWPIRKPRPYSFRARPKKIFLTGQKVLDFFFPCAKGGTVALPGGFGTGKTMLIFQIVKWSNADILIYVGCGERGNEIVTITKEIANLKSRGELLDSRTVYVANTSNMPVAARTSGVFSAMTIAEYFRDQGKSVVLVADSLTRWAEAMREMSNRIGEFPGEEGYPTYLASEIGSFFERAGNVGTLGGGAGSLTVIGSISLYGSDFSDPVAQSAMKVANSLWALDPSLAYVRHYPAINRKLSYTKFTHIAEEFWQEYGNWRLHYDRLRALFGKMDELEKLTAVVGPEMLPAKDQFLLQFGELFTDIFLKQSAYEIADAHRPPKEQMAMVEALMKYYERGKGAIEAGRGVEEVASPEIKKSLMELKKVRGKKLEKKVSEMEKGLVFVEEEV